MPTTPPSDVTAARRYVTRAIEVTLDPSPSQQRWLRSYAGSMRSAYNWVLAEVSQNLAVRKAEREEGLPEAELTPSLSWSSYSLMAHWRATRDESHPWHTEVSIHAFKTGVENASLALKNFSESKSGKRKGCRVGFPRFKNRHSRQSVRFVEMAAGVDHHHWTNQDTLRHVRLMLPQRASDDTWERRNTRTKSEQEPGRDRRGEVAWIRAHQGDAVVDVWRLCETGAAQVQALTLKFDGGRWKAVFRLRVFTDAGNEAGRLRNPGEPAKWHGGAVGVDLGFEHLATLDRSIAGMTRRKGMRLGKSVSDAALGELVGQLDQKTQTSGTTLIKVGRFYRSSKACSTCGAVRAKLPLHVRVFDCTECGVSINRDVNAARNIQREGLRLLREQLPAEPLGTGGPVASIRGETSNGEPRTGETKPASDAGGHGPFEDATVPASLPRAGSRDLAVAAV